MAFRYRNLSIFILYIFFTFPATSSDLDSGQYWLQQARKWEQNLYQNFSDDYFRKTVWGYSRAGENFLKQYNDDKKNTSHACAALESFRELVEVYLAMENPRAALQYFQTVFNGIHPLGRIKCSHADYITLVKSLYECSFKTKNELIQIQYSIAWLETYPAAQCDSVWLNTLKICMDIRDYDNLQKLCLGLACPSISEAVKSDLMIWKDNQDPEDLKPYPKLTAYIEKLK